MDYNTVSAGDKVKWIDPAFLDLYDHYNSDSFNRAFITNYLNVIYTVCNSPVDEDDIIELDSHAEVLASELYPASVNISLDSNFKPLISF